MSTIDRIDRRYLPVFLLGGFVGWFLKSLDVLPRSITAGDVLAAAITLFVGWLIQRELIKHTELSRVPIDAVSKLCDQIDVLVDDAMRAASGTSPANEIVLEKLRLIANEIAWLDAVIGALEADDADYKVLSDAYVDFKIELTADPTSDIRRAALMARRIRLANLRLRWSLRQHILSNPKNLSIIK